MPNVRRPKSLAGTNTIAYLVTSSVTKRSSKHECLSLANFSRRHDTQHYDIQHSETQHKYKENTTLSVRKLSRVVEVCYAEYHFYAASYMLSAE
jgi:hypothetical protein